MKKVLYTIMIPDDMDIDSVVINLKHKSEDKERRKHHRAEKPNSRIRFEHQISDEPDEGLLYDELY